MNKKLATVLLVLATGLTQPTDARAEQAIGEEDESQEQPGGFHRSGFAIGAALVPTVLFESGPLRDLGTVGAGLSLRAGASVTRRLLVLGELRAHSFIFNVNDDKVTNSLYSLVATGQYYVRQAMWAKVDFGIATLQQRTRDGVKLPDVDQSGGLAYGGSLGFDVFQKSSIAVDLEVGVTGSMLWPELADGTGGTERKLALLTQIWLGLGLHWY